MYLSASTRHTKKGWFHKLTRRLFSTSDSAVPSYEARLQEAEQRVAAYEALYQDTRSKLDFVLQNSRLCMYAQDAGLRYIWMEHSEGRDIADFTVGRTDADLFNAANAAMLTSLKRHVLETGETVRRTVSMKNMKGEDGYYNVVIEPSRSDNQITGVRGIAIDVTDEVIHRNAIEKSRTEAQRTDQAKTRFLAAASHDLRQPFQAMRLFLHLLHGKLTTPSQQDLASKLSDSLQAGENLLNALLEITALDAMSVKPTISTFCIGEVLRRLRDEMTPLAASKGLELTVVPCQLKVRSDSTLLDRVLRNLLSNALRYTDKGRIVLGCRRKGGQLSIQVWDTGRGIPNDKLEIIFEEFYQVENVQRDRSQGLGLGLAIVERTARLLNHSVNVQSTLGRGSVFSVDVPIVSDLPYIMKRTEIMKEPSDLKGLIVAVVEDDRLQLMALQMMLEDWGCIPITASRADKALEALAEAGRKPDLIMSDFRLPDGLTGIDVIDAVRTDYGTDIPGLLLTGDTDTSITENHSLERVGIVHKPIHPNRLKSTIEAAVKGGAHKSA